MTQLSVAVRLAGAVLVFFALDSAFFRTGYYTTILESDSTAGYLQTSLLVEQHRPIQGQDEVVAVGDSRIPLKPRVANAAGTGYRFFTIAVPGTSPRCWYDMLREADPDARRYAAIVVPLDTYDDRILEDLRMREIDAHYLAPLLRFADLFDFTLSYPEWGRRAQAAQAVLFKGLVYRRDFQDFLVRHRYRLELARDLNHRTSGWRCDTVWDDGSLEGMRVDWSARTIHFPADVSPERRKAVDEVLLQDQPPPSAEMAAYRRTWFGKIVQRYRGTRTQLIFIRLARGPVVRPGLATDGVSSIRDMAARPEITLVDEHTFDTLERPELFRDALHMNERGGTEFSTMLAREVARVLDGARR